MSAWRTPEERYSRREFCLAVLIACIWGVILIAGMFVLMLLASGYDRRWMSAPDSSIPAVETTAGRSTGSPRPCSRRR